MSLSQPRVIVLCADWCVQCRQLQSECFDLDWMTWLDIEALDVDFEPLALSAFPYVIVLDAASAVRYAGNTRANRASIEMVAQSVMNRNPSSIHPLIQSLVAKAVSGHTP